MLARIVSASGCDAAGRVRSRHPAVRLACIYDRCDGPWRAEVYSKRDGRNLRKTFPTQAAAKAVELTAHKLACCRAATALARAAEV
jgi:hypothetical protein